MTINIYTDGATSNNGYKNAYGGWAYAAFLCETEPLKLLNQDSGYLEPATNNICELTALIKACEWADSQKDQKIILYTDSAYCYNCYQQKWYKKWKENNWLNSKKQAVANKELWEQLIPFFEKENFIFKKVKGHSTDKCNNYVDKIAVEAKSRRK